MTLYRRFAFALVIVFLKRSEPYSIEPSTMPHRAVIAASLTLSVSSYGYPHIIYMGILTQIICGSPYKLYRDPHINIMYMGIHI